MTLQELERQLPNLSPAEKAEMIQILVSDLTHSGQAIHKTPGVMGGEACIGRTRIPVWLMVSYRRQGANDAHILEGYPQLTAADLVNVWAYAEAHPDEIEQAIRDQEEDEEDE
jgi:uncharacterized protein (DUF433 family)